jgi:hypothetical protein
MLASTILRADEAGCRHVLLQAAQVVDLCLRNATGQLRLDRSTRLAIPGKS